MRDARSRVGTSFGSSGVQLGWRVWEAPDSWGTLLLIHGLGEHSGRYDRLAGFLADRGLSTFAFDLRGHGLSAGARGDVEAFPEYLEDVLEMEEEADRQLPVGLPRFLLGHSLGGLIALRRLSAVKVPYAGAVLSSPWLRARVPSWVRIFGRGLGGVLPRISFPNAVTPERLTRDPEMIQEWREDPLIHTQISAGLFREAERAQKEILEHLDSVAIPLLFLVSGADPVVDSRVTIQFVRRLRGDGVEMQILRGFRHEPFNEVDREGVFEMVGGWLAERGKTGTPPA